MKIQSYNDYGPLKSIIVGTATHANFPTNPMFQLQMEQAGWTETPPPLGAVPQWIIDETNHDLDMLATTLSAHGIDVYRPQELNYQYTNGQYGYCPRDNLLVLGRTVIEAPMSTKVRQQEMWAFRDIKRAAIKDNAAWLCAPHPELNITENQLPDGTIQLTELEPIFDAANIARFNKNLLYLVSSSANRLGAEWLQRVAPDYEVHITDVYDAAHIDSTIVPIDEDYVVLNANRVTEENLPWFIKEMNKIWITDDMIVPQDFHKYPYASKWIAINMLSIGNKTVICDKDQPMIIEALEKNGFKVIPQQLRHARTLGGGFHCVTCDLEREL